MSPQQQQQQGMSTQRQQNDFFFQHPFTANVSGPTCSGKTYFVKKLLQNCKTKIVPAPERILWLYKRWQHLYDIIKSTVYPPVEFIQGIPLDLEQDSFIDPRTRNLVILDDLMSTASKDSRVNELQMYLQKVAITETCQSWPLTKICIITKILLRDEIATIW